MKKIRYPSREYELLAEVKTVLGKIAAAGGAYELTLGDDAAIRNCKKNEKLILTTDSAVENVHFSLETMSMSEIGFRVMAANVSDCAAMAALPEAALVNLVFPLRHAGSLKKSVSGLYRGFAEACRRWRFKIVGGDCSAGPCWSIHIAMVGRAPARGRLLLRKGVRPGDCLWVTSFPGRSVAGLAALEKWSSSRVPTAYRQLVRCHVRPDPRPDLGVLLGACRNVHAMMDLSDGISKDCRTLCFENRLGLELSLDEVTPPIDMVSLSDRLGTPWMDWFLHGGEEYSLLFAASGNFKPAMLPREYRASLVRLGIFTDRHRRLLVREGNCVCKLPRGGWDHAREV